MPRRENTEPRWRSPLGRSARTSIEELIDHQPVFTPRPPSPISLSTLARRLRRAHAGPEAYSIVVEPQIALGPDIVVPDLAAWRRDRLLQRKRNAPIALTPDWVCELVTPATEELDRTRKLALYAHARVRNVWLWSALTGVVEVLRLDREHWVLRGCFARGRVIAEPFAPHAIELAR